MKSIFIFLFLFINCYSEKKSNNDLYYLFLLNSENKVYKSLNVWQLGLQSSIEYSKDQNFRITVSKNMKCEESDLVEFKTTCQSVSNLAGICLLSYSISGKINKAVGVVDRDIWFSSDYSDKDKINLLSHEIGHCLGLSHVSENQNIMYAFFSKGLNPTYDPQRKLLRDRYVNGLPLQSLEYFEKVPSTQIPLTLDSLPIFYINLELLR